MTTRERLHSLIDELPEERLSGFDQVLEELARGTDLTVTDRAGRVLFPAIGPSPASTGEERRRILQDLQERFGDRLPSHDEYILDKQREKARDEEAAKRVLEQFCREYTGRSAGWHVETWLHPTTRSVRAAVVMPEFASVDSVERIALLSQYVDDHLSRDESAQVSFVKGLTPEEYDRGGWKPEEVEFLAVSR